MKKIIPLMIALMLLLSACENTQNTAQENTQDPTTGAFSASSDTENIGDMFTDRDYRTDYDASQSVAIQLNGDCAVSSSNAVQITGSTVVLTEEGSYYLSGTLDDGMIVVDAGKNAKLQLVLDGVNVHSETSAALYVREADKVFVTLAEGSENTLSNGGAFTAIDENNIDGAIFSKEDLTLNGSGSLTVTSPAGHGIVAKDDLVFTGGAYTVSAASHGIDANDSVRITGAALTVDAGKDGIHAENDDDTSLGFVYVADGTVNIEAEGDGVSAGSYLQIEDGSFDIVTGGGSTNGEKQTSDGWGGFMGRDPRQSYVTADDDSGESIKGIKATGNLLIGGGTFKINSADDALHSNTSITVNGGTFEIATGDDGFHADEALTVTAGTIRVTESYEGMEALNLTISGGDITLFATDDGLNAAGGMDSSGFGGPRGGERFGGGMGGPMGGGMDGGAMGGSSDGSILISGGNLYVNASGDGIDANGTLTITGGDTVVCGPTQGDTATLDYDVSATITGGTFIGTGAYGMAQTFSDAEQGVIALSVGNQAAGTQITLTDTAGNTVISYAPELPFGVVILSSPDIEKGDTYTITVGTASGEFTAN